jgi:hypothetical protein
MRGLRRWKPGDELTRPAKTPDQFVHTAVRSVVSTAKANGASVLDTVRFVLSAKRSMECIAGVG